jgi:hypothetical protein
MTPEMMLLLTAWPVALATTVLYVAVLRQVLPVPTPVRVRR